MKRAYSTVACMKCSYEEIVDYAVQAGIPAVEIRLDENDRICGLPKEEVGKLVDCLHENHVKISDLGTGVTLLGYDTEKISRAKECARLAALTEAKGIRLFLGNFINSFSEQSSYDYDGIVKALQEICDDIKDTGVEIWVETHNEFSTGRVLRKLIDDVSRDNFKIIWDIIHPIEMGRHQSRPWLIWGTGLPMST